MYWLVNKLTSVVIFKFIPGLQSATLFIKNQYFKCQELPILDFILLILLFDQRPLFYWLKNIKKPQFSRSQMFRRRIAVNVCTKIIQIYFQVLKSCNKLWFLSKNNSNFCFKVQKTKKTVMLGNEKGCENS